LLIAGRGKERKYRLIAQNLGIGNDVIFAIFHREKLERIYLVSEIFSILSKFDTFGIAVLEAMAASLSVIVSGNVRAKDFIALGANGFINEESIELDRIHRHSAKQRGENEDGNGCSDRRYYHLPEKRTTILNEADPLRNAQNIFSEVVPLDK
jgi:glycosyltransferase involved in cell wall biosynthesis